MKDTQANSVIISFEGNINTVESQGIKIYLQPKKGDRERSCQVAYISLKQQRHYISFTRLIKQIWLGKTCINDK